MIYERKINYYETDAMGIVHHSNYIRFFEEARILCMTKMGLPYKHIEDEGVMIPVLGVNCEYKTPSKFDDVILIDVKIIEFNGVRMTVEYKITNKLSNALVAIGTTKHCFTDTSLRPISLKKYKPDMYEMILKCM